MNPWYILGVYLLLELTLIITMIVSLVVIITFRVKKKPSKKPKIYFGLSVVVFLCLNIFIMSHPTYYKYNDWWVEQNNIGNVRERYGDFDFGSYTEGKSGTVGYYIYTDNGPIMPDHMPHYYYIEYDCWGIVGRVYEAGPRGG